MEMQINGRDVITAEQFAKENGFKQYMVGRFVRGKKLEGEKVGREYFVFKDSVEEFKRLYIHSERTNVPRADIVNRDLELGLIDPLRMELRADNA